MTKEEYVILAEPGNVSIPNRVLWVRERKKFGIEGIVIAQGLDASYSGAVVRPATKNEVKQANELAKKNRPPCPVCGELMTVGVSVLFEGCVTSWRCKVHGTRGPGGKEHPANLKTVCRTCQAFDCWPFKDEPEGEPRRTE